MSRKLVDSGVEWIGKVPKDWEIKRIGNLFQQRNEKVSDFDYQPLSVTKNGIVKQLETAAKSSDHFNRKKVCVNDFVINSRSDRKMSSGISSFEGSVSLINLVLYSEFMVPSFVNYLLKNYGFAEEFYRWGTGIVDDLWSTNFSRMKKILIPLPSKEEQQKIANFLDEKVSQINSIIEKTRQSIEESKLFKESLITETISKGLNPNVEMKDSGIKWIGLIPSEWKIIKLKYVANVSGRIGYRGYTTNDIVEPGNGAITLSPSNIANYTLDLENKTYISWEKYHESPEIKVIENDLIFCKTGSSYGKCGIVNKIEHPMTINPQLVIIRPLKIEPKFLNYFLNSKLAKHQIETIVGGSTMPTISQENILQIGLILPNKEAQINLVKYLDKKIDEIDTLISYKEELIKEMEEYKKSLVYEYVTGKKEVL